jgi:aryl-alcohol dehydrogenase-like predicted oxidoreductase
MFGTTWGHGAEPAEARRMFDGYAEAGGNFLDTGDTYQRGESETLVGEFVGANRDDFVIATKYSLGATGAPTVVTTRYFDARTSGIRRVPLLSDPNPRSYRYGDVTPAYVV